MSKLKWIALEVDCSFSKIGQQLSQFPFNTEIGWGFGAPQKSNCSVSCIFVERIVIYETVADPFGSTTELETVRYQTINFKLHRLEDVSRLILEVSDPPRSIRTLISRLSDVLGQVTFVQLTLPLIQMYLMLKKDSPRARIVKLRANDISISDFSLARIDVTSSNDALKDLIALVSSARHHIEKIRIEYPFIDERGFLEISKSGLCSFNETHSEQKVRDLILAMNSGS